MKVIIIKQALNSLRSLVKLKEPLNLYGLVRKNEDLTYVISIGKKNKYLPIIGQVKSNELMPDD